MKVLRMCFAATAMVMSLGPGAALGSGYNIYEQGAAPLGMAGAATASVRDASAMFFNPAAMTRLEGTQLYFGGSLLTPSTSFAGVAPDPGFGVVEEMKDQAFFPPTIYLTRAYENGWAVGVGLNTPFGLATDWQDPDTFTGRHISTRADLKVINTQLSVAYALDPQWSVSAGVNAVFAKVELDRRTLAAIPGGGGAQVDVAAVSLESDFTTDYGWNAALSWAATEQWKLGAYYKSKVVVDVEDGRATFRQITTGNAAFDAAVAASLPPDQAVSTVLRFPAMWSAGVAWMPAADWTLEVDVGFIEWSVFRDLPIRFAQTPEENTTIIEDYDDAFQIRAGAEHRLPSWTYRFGYYFDEAAAPTESVSPILPDANRHGATVGLGFPLGADKRWSIDLYELAVFVERRDTEGLNRDGYNGEYKSFVNSAGVSVSYRW